MLEKFSERARLVIFLARLKARQRGAQFIETGDMLVAIIIEDQGDFPRTVSTLLDDADWRPQIDTAPTNPFLTSALANEFLARLEALTPRSQPQPETPGPPASESVKHAFTAAAFLCDRLQQSQVDPLHLLAAFLEYKSSRAARVFLDAGITCEKVIAFIKGDT